MAYKRQSPRLKSTKPVVTDSRTKKKINSSHKVKDMLLSNGLSIMTTIKSSVADIYILQNVQLTQHKT